jgi:hypothetical protein
MSVIINASTTSGLVMTSDLSGVLTLQQNGVSLPNGGVAPAFSASLSSNQSVTASTWTKVQCNTEQFDTNSNYDNATNYRFTPTVAGYYQITGSIGFNYSGAASSGGVGVSIYKNGSSFANVSITNSVAYGILQSSRLIYFNGSTDYAELYGFNANGTPTFTGDASLTWFTGSLVRGA